MKGRKILLVSSLLIVITLAGGAGYLAGNRHTSSAQYQGNDITKVETNRKLELLPIAVVNLDEGTLLDNGERIFYAEKTIRFPSGEISFLYTSLAEARQGIIQGRYGAYIVIPATFSDSIESLNRTPLSAILQYTLNTNIKGEAQRDTLQKILTFGKQLNNDISFMYLANILREFHNVQDKSVTIMNNDLEAREAIDQIQAMDLIELISMPEIANEENTTAALDLSEFSTQNTLLLSEIDRIYQDYVEHSMEQLIALHEEGRNLSDVLESLSREVDLETLLVNEYGVPITTLGRQVLSDSLEEYNNQLEERRSSVRQSIASLEDKLEEMYEDLQKVGDLLYLPGENNQNIQITNPETEKQGSAPIINLSLFHDIRSQIDEMKDHIGELEPLSDEFREEVIDAFKEQCIVPLIRNMEQQEESFRQRHNEEIEHISIFQGSLANFRPRIDISEITQAIATLSANHMDMQNALLENNQSYMEHARRVELTSQETILALQDYIHEAGEISRSAVEEGLRHARSIKASTSSDNQELLQAFAQKLPYTRFGTQEYIQAYRFITNPVEFYQLSGEPRGNETANSLEDDDRMQVSSITTVSSLTHYMTIVLYTALGSAILVLLRTIVFKRKKKGEKINQIF